MARLEELMTPSELVNAIRDGAAKNELIKKYKASEQELAMMLLPVYRRGEFTKEEFNNFFKGVPVKRADETRLEGSPAEDSPPQPEFEPPSEILKALSKSAQQMENEVQVAPSSENAAVVYEESIVPESAATDNILNMILAKVTAIDVRLSEIEKKFNFR